MFKSLIGAATFLLLIRDEMATIVDIDGTLLGYGNKPIKRVIDYVNSLDTVYIVTARPESRRKETVRALRQAGVKYNRLLMNSVGPTHKDGLESKRLNAKKIKGSVSTAIENDAGARRIYEQEGINAINPSSIGKTIWQGTFAKP